jgi:hypothetical protein
MGKKKDCGCGCKGKGTCKPKWGRYQRAKSLKDKLNKAINFGKNVKKGYDIGKYILSGIFG